MIARAKNHVFTVMFLALFPLEGDRFLACAVYVLHYIFQNRNRAAQIDDFIGEYCGNVSYESNMKMTSPFRLDTNTL